MKSRNELVWDAFCALLSRTQEGQLFSELLDCAGDAADAFLAAAGEQPRQEREPDAVWVLSNNGQLGTDTPYLEQAIRLLRGRERVRLRVYVEEVE